MRAPVARWTRRRAALVLVALVTAALVAGGFQALAAPAPALAAVDRHTVTSLRVGQAMRPGQSLRSKSGRARLRITRRGTLVQERGAGAVVLYRPKASAKAVGTTRLTVSRTGRLMLRRGHAEVWAKQTVGVQASRATLDDSGRVVLWRGSRPTGAIQLVPPAPAATVSAPAVAPSSPVSDPTPVPSGPAASPTATTIPSEPSATPATAPQPTASAASAATPQTSATPPTVATPTPSTSAAPIVLATPTSIGSVLASGAELTTDQRLTSSNGTYTLAMQHDGNLVEYGPGGALWTTGTATGADGSSAVMQPDGDLVVVGADGPITWRSATAPNRGSRLVLQDDGNLVLVSSGELPIWSSRGGRTIDSTDVLGAGHRLSTGQSLVSASTAYRVVMQGDGNLVEYGPNGVAWASNTMTGSAGSFAILQGDGNLVVYTASGQARWSSSTVGSGAARLVMQDDGNLVLYDAAGVARWASRGISQPAPATSGLNSAILQKAQATTIGGRGGQCLSWVLGIVHDAGGPSQAFGLDASTYQSRWSRIADQVGGIESARPGDVVQWYAPTSAPRGEMEHTAIVVSLANGITLRDSNWLNDGIIREGTWAARNGWMTSHYGANPQIWRVRG